MALPRLKSLYKVLPPYLKYLTSVDIVLRFRIEVMVDGVMHAYLAGTCLGPFFFFSSQTSADPLFFFFNTLGPQEPITDMHAGRTRASPGDGCKSGERNWIGCTELRLSICVGIGALAGDVQSPPK